MRTGLGLIVLGHGSLVLGAIVHGSVLRHVAGARRAVTPEYAAANVVSVCSGLLSIAAGIVAILVSHNLSRAALSRSCSCRLQHWALLSVSLLNCLLSTACSDTALALWIPSLLLAAAEAVLSGRSCLVALVFRGIGPCAHGYGTQQLARPSTAMEKPLRGAAGVL
ncbi:hypothetical protein IHE44_0009869 [Lamprotornis superbus]|uniref:Keratinocyte-associated protein 3 n=1 Tax=Lamprotornis superbus TaxID=245042 RepID=A0A835NFP7_9PASS|nr:hypothetical protein IHE44_0009869 [Lamprotornis superbus]